MLIACENRDGKSGFVAIEAVAFVTKQTVADFARRRIKPAQPVRTDASAAINSADAPYHPHQAGDATEEGQVLGLPWVHIVIANLKRFVLGTYHGIGPNFLQGYLDELAYRFNRLFWEPAIPNRLLRLWVEHVPVLERGTGLK